MKHMLFALGIFAVMISVSPASAMEAEKSTDFKALDALALSAPMTDSELAAIEGQAPPQVIGQAGLVNVGAQVQVNNNDIDVRVIRDITIQDVNVAVLSAGGQR